MGSLWAREGYFLPLTPLEVIYPYKFGAAVGTQISLQNVVLRATEVEDQQQQQPETYFKLTKTALLKNRD